MLTLRRRALQAAGRPLPAAAAVHSLPDTREQGAPADTAPLPPPPPPPPPLPPGRAAADAAAGSSNWHARLEKLVTAQRRGGGSAGRAWRSFAAAPLAQPRPAGEEAPQQHAAAALAGQQQQQQQRVDRGVNGASKQRQGYAAGRAAGSQLAPAEQGLAAEDLAVVHAAAAGGDEQRLIALLRERGSTALFNAALHRVPIIQMLALLDVLPQHQQGEGSKLSSSSGGGGGGGGSNGSSCSIRSTLRPDEFTARILLERLPASELHWELDSALDKLLAAGLKPHYHLFLPWATLHANLGRPQAVRKVMERVERYNGTLAPHYYAQLIKAYCTAGRWREAEPVLQEMRDRGVPPSEHVYRSLIWCNGRHHRADRAQAVFDEMLASGLEPGMPTWSALLNAYADSKQPLRAVEALKRMREQNLKPSVKVYGALAKGFARSGDWRRAIEVINLMQCDNLEPNEQVFGSVIEAAAVAGKPSVAAEVLRRMRLAGVEPNVIAYTSLLSSYSATGDLEGAKRVLQDMAAAGCQPNVKTYTELMSQLAAKGRYEECEHYFQQMTDEGCPLDSVSYAILIDSMLRRWNADREGQPQLLALIQERWEAAAAGPLAPRTYLHQPQGRLTLDLHGYSAWTAQLAVLSMLRSLLRQHRTQGRITDQLSRLDIITGRGNRSVRKHQPIVREIVLEMLQHLLPVTLSRKNDGLLLLEARKLARLFNTLQGTDPLSLVAMQHCLVDPGQ